MLIAHHWIRVGTWGELGAYRAVDDRRYPRGARVIVRTGRGLEVGEVVAVAEEGEPARGELLRGLTTADELLVARLNKNRLEALEACERLLAERGLQAPLVDVEVLFDGQSLIFYFLGTISDELAQITTELAATFDAQVQLARFAETLAHGCGPDCGSEQAAGHGCSNCSTGCAVSSACGVQAARGRSATPAP